MPERVILREHFASILAAARSAAEAYARLARAEHDPLRRQELQRLARDRQRHVELSERLLEIVSE